MRVVQMNAFSPPSEKKSPPYFPENKNNSHKPGGVKEKTDLKKIISGFSADDWILAIIIVVLILEGCDDYILLAALGYLFIMGIV